MNSIHKYFYLNLSLCNLTFNLFPSITIKIHRIELKYLYAEWHR